MELLLIDGEEYTGPLVKDLINHEFPNSYVLQVSDCDLGLQQLKNRRFDVVVLDHSIAKAQDLECLRFIREMYKDLPMVVLTATANDETHDAFERVGVDGYVVKPFIRQLLGPTTKGAITQRRKLVEATYKTERTLSRLKEAS